MRETEGEILNVERINVRAALPIGRGFELRIEPDSQQPV